ncbi:MAG: hypothetical protein ACI83O_000327 [Patescibacteria group bacterium]|jgi:hypothetical protein
MTFLSDAIGDHFEEFIQDNFQTLYHKAQTSIAPDFYDAEHEFYIEAKVGYQGWGPRIKRYQVENFTKDLNHRTIYAIGLHTMSQSTEKTKHLKTKQGIRNRIDKELEIAQVTFISDEIIQKIYHKAHKVSESGKHEYFMLKPAILKDIFQNREFKREGKTQTCESYYKFNPVRYETYQEGIHNYTPWQAIINPEQDKSFRRFLEYHEML